MLCFRKYVVAKKFMLKKVRGVSQSSVEKFLSHSAERIRRGTFKSFNNFGYQKKLFFTWLCHDFPSKIFCLTVLKHFVGEPFCAVFQKVSGGEKVCGKEVGGGLLNLSVENFFVVEKNCGSEKIYG